MSTGRDDRETAAARAALDVAVVDLIVGLPELVMYGAVDDRLAEIADRGGRLSRMERPRALPVRRRRDPEPRDEHREEEP